AVFRKVDATQEPHGDAEQRGAQEELGASHDRIRHAAPDLPDGCREVQEEARRHRRRALVRDVGEEEEEDAQRGRRGEACGAEHDPLDETPAAVRRARHAIDVPRVFMPAISSRASAFTTIVMPNSTSAIWMRADT